MRKVLFVCSIVFVTSLFVQAAESNPQLLLRFPTVSRTQIVFNYGGDLWIVSRDGGEARQLTSGVGIEALPIALGASFPRFKIRLHLCRILIGAGQ